jgi:glycosyltransferase involved in cell wall biosynthesis
VTPVPDVSVVVATKDRSDVIEPALRSALAQEGVQTEVIVVADGSSMAHAAAYAELAERLDPRVRVLHHPDANGPGAARNRGIDAARGRFLAVLDDDNQFLPGMLAAQTRLAEGADDVVAVCGVEIVSPDGRIVTERPPALMPRSLAIEADPFSFIRPRAFWATFVAPVELIRRVGAYDAALWFGEHTELLLRLFDRAMFAARPDIGVRVHRHYGLSHASRSWEHKAEGTRHILEIHAARFDRMPKVKARWLDVLGMTYLRLGSRSQAREAFADSVRTKPSARALAHLVGAATGTAGWLAPGGADDAAT